MPRITGQEPTKPFVIEVDSVPIGYIQKYYVDDDPDIKPGVKGRCVGLDLFIGEEAYLGRGLGSRILEEFLQQIAFQEVGIDGCVVDPSPANKRMIRVNENAGFKYLITTSGSDPKYLMYRSRD
jgi:RimJ/RimL family protein N-acetyltransferase